MDVQAQKNELIQWLSDIDDPNIIEVLTSIKFSILNKKVVKTTPEERKAIDQGLTSIETSGTKSNMEVIKTTRSKYPHLFK